MYNPTHTIRAKRIQAYINKYDALSIPEIEFNKLAKQYKMVRFVDIVTRESFTASIRGFKAYGTTDDKGFGNQRWLAIQFFDWHIQSKAVKRFEDA